MKIKHYDHEKGQWIVDGASHASLLELNNPAYSETPISIDEAFSLINGRINRMDKNLTWIYNNGARGGGGEGGTTTVNISLDIIGEDTIMSATGQDVILNYEFFSKYIVDDYPTGPGIAQWRNNDLLIYTQNINQGLNSFNITRYLKPGDNTIQLTVRDTENNQRTVVYNITVVELRITSVFNYRQPYTGNIPFIFTPTGNINKTIHFLIDEVEVGSMQTTASNRQLTYNIPAQRHGAHSLEAYISAEIDGKLFYSNTLEFEIICLESGNNTPIITSSFNTEEVAQYDIVNIEYLVYDPTQANPTIELKVDDDLLHTITIDRNVQIWNYRFNIVGETKLTIALRETVKDFIIQVESSDIDVNPVTDDLVLFLTSAGRNNNEQDPSIWEYKDIRANLTGFNYVNNGWILNKGEVVLRVNSGARVEIPYKIFEKDFKNTGKTIEFEFSTSDISNYDNTVISCMFNNVGLQIKTQDILLRSEQSTLTAKFKEDEKVRISFVIEKIGKENLILAYINGIISGTVQYPSNDNFVQHTPVNITIGNDDCNTDIYNIRIYDNDLTWTQVLENYIADLSTLSEKRDVYIRNNIYDVYGGLDYVSLLNQLPCMTITGELPKYKSDIKTVDIEFTNLQNPSKSFTLKDAQIDVQGTSSQYYPRYNWVFYPTQDFRLADGTSSRTYVLKDGNKPARIFCTKADYMESSGTHNTGLSTLANEVFKDMDVRTPPQRSDNEIRTTIDGYPIVIFHKLTEEDDRIFYGKYNFNHDKEAEEIFGFTNPLVHESWEFLNNTSDNVLFKKADFTSVDPNGTPIWLSDFSARYPQDYLYSENLEKVCAWVASTANDLNKFRLEVEEHFNLQNLIAYYVYTEIFGMVDQRAKNQFITSWGRENDSDEYIWYFLVYDSDTGLGLNNEGVNRFGYNIEYHDKLGNADVWNGEQSVLWNNLEKTYYSQIEAFYQQLILRNIISYEKANEYLNTNQSDKWNETVYNMDAQFKYIDPVIDDNNTTYLYAAQGSRLEHRKWWLFNRFRYLDSKYNIGDFLQDFATMRIYTPNTWEVIEPQADFHIIPYADQYIQIKYGSYITKERGFTNIETHIKAPTGIQFNDTETIIYGASRISSLGDLSGHYPGTVDVTQATKLKELIIGNQTDGYRNTNMHTLAVGNNKLLRKLDISNCPELTGSIDLTGCENIEEIYAHGSGVSVFNLSTSGILNKLYLPDSITNLTLKNQLVLTNDGIISEGFNNVGTLILDNLPNINVGDLFNAILDESNNLQRIRVTDLNLSMPDLEMLLELMNYAGIDDTGATSQYPWLTGEVYVDVADSYDLDIINTTFPFLVVSYDELIHIPVRRISVIRGKDNSAVKEHLVTINGNPYYTDELGMVVLRTPDTLTVRVELEGHRTEERLYNPVVADTDYEIKMANFVTVSILVKSTDGDILKGALVSFNGETKETNIQGIAQFYELLFGTYALSVTYGNTYSDTVTVGYNDLIHTYGGVVVPERTIKFRHQTASSSFSNIAGLEVYIDNVLYTTNSVGEVVYKGAESIVVETTDTSYKAINQTLPAFYTDTRLDIINMYSLYTAEISVVGKNGYPLNGALVTLGSATAVVINGIAHIPNISYATGVNLKVTFGGEEVTETVSLGYTSYSKTITLQVDEIESMKPVPNGNIQILAKASSTSTTELALNVRGWSGQNATIDWGDGSAPEVIVADKTFHTYPDLSLYDIEISNATNLTMADLEQTSTSSGGYYACVVAYWSIGNSAVGGIFSNRSTAAKPNLMYLGDDVFINDAGRTNWSYLLRGASKLVNLPASLNKDVVAAATTFYSCFLGCTSLTSIPEGLFDNCVNATSFRECFSECTSLTSIPAGLFDNCVAAINFQSCFSECSSLTSIPAGLFDDCENVITFNSCFKGCSSLTSIPAGIFDNCVRVTTFGECFRGCSSLTSIPKGLFDNCVNVTDFSNCFNGCSSLTSIPEGLFDNCVNVTNFGDCFNGCSSLTSIPKGLFDNCVNVTDFRFCFYGCSSLVYCEIPMLKLDASRGAYLNGASYLTVLVSNSITPPVITTNTIPNNTNLKIYVPDASVTDYKTATNWVAHASKIYPLSQYENN